LKQLKKIEMETQQKMVEALKQEKLSPERFQEIAQQRNNPDPASAGVSPSDVERFDKAVANSDHSTRSCSQGKSGNFDAGTNPRTV
jgi:hypothetical protein